MGRRRNLTTMKRKLRLFIGIFIMAFLTSCGPKPYTGVMYQQRHNGSHILKTKKYKSLSKCQRKSKRLQYKRWRARNDNPNYGIR